MHAVTGHRHGRIFVFLFAISIVSTALGLSPAIADPTTNPPPPPKPVTDTDDGSGRHFGIGVIEQSPNAKPSISSGAAPAGGVAESCGYTMLEDTYSLSAYPALWVGHEPGSGHLYRKFCDAGGVLNAAPVFLANDTPPPPDPAVLAQQAIDSIQFPVPQPHLGPETLLAVNRWIYLTVDDPGTLTAQAAVPGLAITASATLTSSTWSMGQITEVGKRSTVAPLTCVGGGRAPSANANLHASKPAEPGTCAYAYELRSLPERTGGTGTWPVTVTTTWSITWAATDGTTGTATRSQTSDTFPASVGEWASELVPG